MKADLLLCCVALAAGLHAQVPTVSTITNSASFSSIVSPGAIVSILGSNFGDSPADITVTVGGLDAPVLFVSHSQINVQFPLNLSVGPTTLRVTVHGNFAEPASVTISAHAPAMFTTDGSGAAHGVFTNARGLVTTFSTAAVGETITAYMVGLGMTNPPVAAGALTPASPAPACVTVPTITVGGVSAKLEFAGLYPGLVGVYQVDFVVPQVSPGDHNMVVSIGGMSSPIVTLPVGAAPGPAVILRDIAGTTRTKGPALSKPGNGAGLPVDCPQQITSIGTLTRVQRLDANPKGKIRIFDANGLPSTSLPSATNPDSSSRVVAAAVSPSLVYTCDASVAALAGVCAFLNGTIASLYTNAFTNVTANIYVKFGNTELGMSNTSLNLLTYTQLRNALIANASSANDMTALNNSVPAAEPAIFGGAGVAITNANARALGLTLSFGGLTPALGNCNLPSAGCYDGVITISSSVQSAGQFYYRSGSISPNQYDFYSVVEHETDEVLGTMSCALATCVFNGVTYLAPADLFRYHSNGTRTFGAAGSNSSCSSSSSTNACFSLNGVVMLQQYNNLNNGEDVGDWATNCATPHVQDAAACAGVANLDISPTAEILVLDVVGFTIKSNQPPTSVSVTPSSGSGSSQVFSFLYSDPNGFADIPWVQMLFNSSLTGLSGCYTHYDRASNMVLLLNDAASGWLGPITLGTANTLQNSQCSVNAQSSSASGTGNNLTVNLALTFMSSFGGTKNIYMQTVNNAGQAAVWQQRGTWTPFSNQAPATISVSPSSGTGSVQTFSFVYSDSNGFTDLPWVQMIVNTSLSGSGACYTHYDRPSNAVLLLNDAASAWLGPVTLGTVNTLQNNQCSVNARSSSASGAGNNLTVNLNLSFKSAFLGTKNVYMQTQDTGGLATGWQQRGTWTVNGPVAPLAVSVTPSSGAGSSRVFSFVYSDANGFGDLPWVQMLVNATLNGAAGCYTHYDRASNSVLLLNDAATAWLGPVTLGTVGTLQNNQCTVNAQSSSASGAGTNLTVNLSLTFKPAFAGSKSIYMQTQDNGGFATGWQQRGTWTAQ